MYPMTNSGLEDGAQAAYLFVDEPVMSISTIRRALYCHPDAKLAEIGLQVGSETYAATASGSPSIRRQTDAYHLPDIS
ncbi:hypothetical protein [Acidicapsa ligni]|uniref:hypothetical protein n=1 Tax=Acidicapsa ligni TaxID=542300 RepID=UPI0021E035AC|nr:hypothetical protein [Acidicapsa ligni]